jgi:hypothetical protein
MPFLLLLLLLVISLLAIGSFLAKPILTFLHRYFPGVTCEAEILVLWSGLLLSAFMIGLLVMYLLLQ